MTNLHELAAGIQPGPDWEPLKILVAIILACGTVSLAILSILKLWEKVKPARVTVDQFRTLAGEVGARVTIEEFGELKNEVERVKVEITVTRAVMNKLLRVLGRKHTTDE